MNKFKFIDLTHIINPTIPTWEGKCGFKHITMCNYSDCQGDTKFQIQNIEMRAGIGTHIDAPLHCAPGGRSIADLTLEELIVPVIVVDVSDKANENYLLQIKDIEEFEHKYGKIEAGSCVIIYTGWDKLWNDPVKYHNNYKFPTIAIEAAQYLLSKNIVGLGIDTLSADIPESGFPVHKLFLSNDKYLLENVANANQLPATNSYIMAMPLKIEDGTESPIRLVGFSLK